MANDSINNFSGLAGVLAADQVARLRDHWIETAEQFLAAVATEEGKAGMCNLLALEESQLEDCVKRLTEGLSPDVIERLQSTRPGGELGAILPGQPVDQNDNDVELGDKA